VTVHSLAPAMFDGIGSGLGGSAAVSRLAEARYSRHLLLLRHLLTQWPGDPERLRDVLERSRVAAPDRFASVVGAPMVGGWSAIATRSLVHPPADPRPLGHLAAMALVAAAAAEIDASVRIPVDNGAAMLPGLGAVVAEGRADVEATTSDGRIEVRLDGTRIEVPAEPATEAPGWLPLRRLNGDMVRIDLEDLDPYRHGHHTAPAGRLSAEDAKLWEALFGGAWQLLTDHLPQRAAELAVGMRSLVPLVRTGSSATHSASLRHVFGACGLTRPSSAHDFVVTLVHEFQHSKLSALLDMYQLTDPLAERLYFAPWRTDPRPLASLLQGVYAFAAIADTWLALRDEIAEAEARFAESRLQVDRGLTAIERSGALTSEGVDFTAALRRTVDKLLTEPVSPSATRSAEQLLSRIRTAWEAHNGLNSDVTAPQ
jgi:HEXXH motif-containing protein